MATCPSATWPGWTGGRSGRATPPPPSSSSPSIRLTIWSSGTGGRAPSCGRPPTTNLCSAWTLIPSRAVDACSCAARIPSSSSMMSIRTGVRQGPPRASDFTCWAVNRAARDGAERRDPPAVPQPPRNMYRRRRPEKPNLREVRSWQKSCGRWCWGRTDMAASPAATAAECPLPPPALGRPIASAPSFTAALRTRCCWPSRRRFCWWIWCWARRWGRCRWSGPTRRWPPSCPPPAGRSSLSCTSRAACLCGAGRVSWACSPPRGLRAANPC